MKAGCNVKDNILNKLKIPLITVALLVGAVFLADNGLEGGKNNEYESEHAYEYETTSDAVESESLGNINYVDVPFNANDIPAYAGEAYTEVNGNVPYYDGVKLPVVSSEYYSELDTLGRCGVAYACVGLDILPTKEREEIGMVKPSGWHTVKYNGLIEGNYLYNRCHLIGYQLTGENANVNNLITGTRSMNVEGMMPFENKVENYVKATGNHVMYRVTPVFVGDNLLATGVLMEAKSVEDNGEGILFCVFVYNIQRGVVIDYATGESYLDETATTQSQATEILTTEKQTTTEQQATSQGTTTAGVTGKYAVNMNNGKIHIVGECSATGDGEHAMNYPMYFDTYEEAEAYSIQIAPNQKKRQCGNCW